MDMSIMSRLNIDPHNDFEGGGGGGSNPCSSLSSLLPKYQRSANKKKTDRIIHLHHLPVASSSQVRRNSFAAICKV